MPSTTQSRTLPLRTASWTDSVTLSQTDPALGIDSIGLSLTGTIDTTVLIESRELAPGYVSVFGSGRIVLDSPGGSPLVTVSPESYLTAPLAAFDGAVDWTGPSGGSFERIDTSSATRSLPDTAFLIGAGTVQLPVSASSQVQVTAPGNFSARFGSNAGATVESTAVTATGGGGGGSSGGSGFQSFTPSPPPNLTGTTKITQQRAVADTTTGWTSTLSFSGFDPSLGTLAAVEVSVAADTTGGVVAENLGADAEASTSRRPRPST